MASDNTKKRIWQTTLILTLITVTEFVIAGVWKEGGLGARNAIYGILTLFKAYFIVAVFMHLGDEIRKLAMAILLPFLFILWLVIGLVWEGGYWGKQDKKTMGAITPVVVTTTHVG